MLPDILKQVGPQQYEYLKNFASNLDKTAAGADDDDDVPDLVGTNFEDVSKK